MDQETYDQKLQRAIGLHNEGRLDAAETLYREVLSDKPGQQTALHLLGVIAHQRGHYREAVDLIEAALAGGATNAAIHTNCGVAARALGDIEKATRHIAWAIALDPEFAEAHYNYALLLLDQGLAQQAAAHLEIVLELRQDSAKANLLLGRIRLEEDKPALAAERLREALRLQAGDAEAHLLLGRALLAVGDIRAALHNLEAAAQLQPEQAAVAMLAAKASFELCHEADALAYLAQALRPASGDTVRRRAERARLGKIDLWCAASGTEYARLARPQWLRLRQPKALPAEHSPHFSQPAPFAAEIFHARLKQARVLPDDLLLLSSNGQLFLDGFVRYPQQYALREDGAIRHCADDGRLLLALPERSVTVEQPCVWLGAGGGHFQWMFESLARLWAIEQQPELQALPMIVQTALTRWQDELLQLLGYGVGRRIEVAADTMLECRELHAVSLVSVGHFIAPVAIQHLRREFMRRVAPAADAPRRIYLSRGRAATRRLANEAELLPLLEQHGIVTVHTDAMSATEQLALFQSAEFILGVDGAALVNLVVAPAHAKVGVIFTRGLYQPRHYYVSAPIGHDFTYLCAEPDYASHATLAECDLRLEPAVLRAFLEECPT